MYVLDGVFVGANDYNYLVKAMVVAAMLGTPLLLAVQPLNLGLVSFGCVLLMSNCLCVLVWFPDLSQMCALPGLQALAFSKQEQGKIP